MPLRTYACASFLPVRDRQTPRSCFPRVISSQPAPQLGMIIGPPSKSWLEKDSLEDAERLRGGGLGCACCGGDGNSQQLPPLEPQPNLAENKTTPTEQTTPKAPSKQQVPRLSQPTPPQPKPSEKTPSDTKSTGTTLAVPSRSSRTHSSPSAPPTIPAVSQASGPSRTRHQTLPSKFSTSKPTQVSSPSSSPPMPEGTIDYGRGVIQSPAFPPSVHIVGGNRKAAGGPPPITAPFMKD
ncbi:unnamed protein product [Rhizoctonia solani]|uniref:Uncharacterized protein n=1 Tax=Rhizoctonia solani TaxID=456999 RepID=A0A8H3H2G4_9AGAM|nr:unnamed protein product [Rhizoctonia solani]CAE6477177.1 unnamed protein product [Rhizoctonia solani]